MPPSDPADPTDEPTRLPVRRRPRLSRFLVVGALIGFVVGAVTSLLGPDAPGSSAGQEVILLGATGAVFVGLAAAIVYLALDRRAARD
ncbi:hypothetical protein [uncultured Serinicoccus sp.]|uniref:hypothetical protein n=1 Tax=uncultured Serinicoccus sp. TaxID=735514 RepID=UPI002634F37B|nr:hypothetical protein [uncultured Serinicoccus sp.]